MSFAGEQKERSLAKELVGSNLSAESVALSFPIDGAGEELREAPFVFIPDLNAMVIQLLDQNDK